MSDDRKCIGCGHAHGPAIGNRDCNEKRARDGKLCQCIGYITTESQAAGVLALWINEGMPTREHPRGRDVVPRVAIVDGTRGKVTVAGGRRKS